MEQNKLSLQNKYHISKLELTQVSVRVVTAEMSFTGKTVGYSDCKRNGKVKRELQVPQTTEFIK
jgi:hypothetical protein